MSVIFRPLVSWPGQRTRNRKRSPFSVQYGKILASLSAELRHLNARDVVIQAECDESDIRLDGHIRSTAKMRGPGVVITFDCKHGTLSYACDTYTDWPANIRAITLTLEALRRIDRYGATKGAQQYRGWKALPDGQPIAAAEWSSADAARRWLAELVVLPSGTDLRTLFREAAKVAHPDAGGSAELMSKVNRAKALIEKGGGF